MDEKRLEAMTERYMAMTTGAAVMAVMAVADRSGLLAALAGRGPVTLREVVEASGLHERYGIIIHATLCAASFIEYDAERSTYTMSEEAAACLADEDNVHFLGGWSQIVPSLHAMIPRLVEATRRGGGVPFSEYPVTLIEGFSRTSRPEMHALLASRWLPRVPGLVEQLERGIEAADLGCGAGDAVFAMARAFPRSRFTGLDLNEASIVRAREHAVKHGLANAQFELVDPTRAPEARFAFILAIDVIHDVAHPVEVLRAVRRSLLPGGTFLMSEPDVSDELADNLHPGGALMYAMSTLHCTSVSLALGGEGVGPAWGPRRAEAACREAGFTQFAKLTMPSSYNAFYQVR